jgi:two-component sensor histidine kinase
MIGVSDYLFKKIGPDEVMCSMLHSKLKNRWPQQGNSTKRAFVHIICLWAALIPFYSRAQEAQLDTIEAVLARTTDQKQRKILLLQAAKGALKTDSSVIKVSKYLAQYRSIPGIEQDSNGLMEALRVEAHADMLMGNFSRSVSNFLKCHTYFERKADTANLVLTADQLGSMYSFMGQNEKAQNYLLQVYKIRKQKGDRHALAGATNGLAILYANTNQEDKAIERYKEALAMYQTVQDTMGQANVHANLGITYVDRGDYPKAEYHIGMQGRLDSLLNNQWGLGFFFDYLGYLREKQGRYQEAYGHHLQSLKIREHLASHYNLIESRISLANVLLKLGRFDKAIQEANKVLNNYEKRSSLHQLQSAYGTLSNAFEAKNDFKRALDYRKLHGKMVDSIYNKEMLETITEKDALFENALKESEIALLNVEKQSSQRIIDQKNRTIAFGGVGLFLVSILCLGLYLVTRKYLKQKEALATALNEKDILLREIHHRVKNNLQLVSSLLTLQGRSINDSTAQMAINEGKNRIRSMALIHQDLYQKENITAVNANEYFKKLCHELLETYSKTAEQVDLNLEIEPIQIDVDTLVPLGLMTNEIITNSLKYAFPDKRKGRIRVVLEQKGNTLVLILADNGMGYDPLNIPKNSFGHRLIYSLAEQLEAKISIQTQNGTTNTIELPYLKNH